MNESFLLPSGRLQRLGASAFGCLVRYNVLYLMSALLMLVGYYLISIPYLFHTLRLRHSSGSQVRAVPILAEGIADD